MQVLAEDLQYTHVPTSQGDILKTVGLNYRWVRRPDRDPAFREGVLAVYDYQCVICGFDVKLDQGPIALEAANIKWFQAGGPDVVNNALCLCVLHHKLFDRGAMGIKKVAGQNLYITKVSPTVTGTCGYQEWVRRYENQRFRPPKGSLYYPEPGFVQWHLEEVFRG